MRAAFVVVVSILLVLVAAIAGCSGDEAPPYDELTLRDALRADPRSIETVPAPMKKALADRFERAADGAADPTRVEVDPARLSAHEIVGLVDERRSATQADAWVLAVVDVEDAAVAARAPKTRIPEDPSKLPPLPALEGEAASEGTRAAETRALEGRAGAFLRALLAETGAAHVVRVSTWPIAAVVVGDVLYVNGAWLVSMAALEKGGAETKPAPPFIAAEPRPASMRGNPYSTYTTLAACISDVTGRCEDCRASGSCDASATLDFPDGKSECLFLLEDKRRAEQLCILALTSIATIAECVKADGCIPPSTNTSRVALALAEPFLQKEACVRSLNLCLSGKNETQAAPSNDDRNDVRVDGCSDPFKSCSSFFGGCTDACDRGKCNGRSGPSCKSCDGCDGCTRCSGCSDESRRGGGTGYGSQGTGQNPGTSSGSSSGTSSGGSSGTSSGGSSGTSSGTSSGMSSGGSSGTSSGSSGSSSGSASSSSGSSASSSSSSGGSSGESSSSSGCGKSSTSSSSGSNCGSCKSCDCKGSSSGNGCKCEEAVPAPDAEEPSPLGPVSSVAWLAAPLAFLGKRARGAGKKRKQEEEVAS